MLQIKDLLLSPIAPFMSCHALPFVPNLYRTGFDGRLHFPAGGHWRGIEVRPYPHATRTVHCGKAHLGQVKTLGRERQQMLLLSLHRRSDVLLPPANRPLLVRLTPRQQLPVELLQIPALVAPVPSDCAGNIPPRFRSLLSPAPPPAYRIRP